MNIITKIGLLAMAIASCSACGVVPTEGPEKEVADFNACIDAAREGGLTREELTSCVHKTWKVEAPTPAADAFDEEEF